MTTYRSRALRQAYVLSERRDFTNDQIIAIRHLVAEGRSIREIAEAFPLIVGIASYRKKLRKLGIHPRRATSDVRLGDDVHIGGNKRASDYQDMRSYRPKAIAP